MRPLLSVEPGVEVELLLRFREILPPVPLNIEVAAPECGVREVEVRLRDVEIDIRGSVILLRVRDDLCDELLRDRPDEIEDEPELERDEELRLLPELFDDDALRLRLAGNGEAMIIMMARAANSVKNLLVLYFRIIISSIYSAPAANDSLPELYKLHFSFKVAICKAYGTFSMRRF